MTRLDFKFYADALSKPTSIPNQDMFGAVSSSVYEEPAVKPSFASTMAKGKTFGGRKVAVKNQESMPSFNRLKADYMHALKKMSALDVAKNKVDIVLIAELLEEAETDQKYKSNLSKGQKVALKLRQVFGNFFAKLRYGPSFTHNNIVNDTFKIMQKKCATLTGKDMTPEEIKKLREALENMEITHKKKAKFQESGMYGVE